MSNDTAPFRTDVYRVEANTGWLYTITIESYHDGQVDAHRQRNGSGAYNARRYTRWLVRTDYGPGQIEFRSRYGETKWEAYESARQAIAPTGPRWHTVVKAEMAEARV